MSHSTENQTLIESILTELKIEEEIIQLEMKKYHSAGGLIMVICFLFLFKRFNNHEDPEYLAELELLEAAKTKGETEKKEWLQKKYNELKLSSNLASNLLLILDGMFLPTTKSSLKEAVQALSTHNHTTPKIH